MSEKQQETSNLEVKEYKKRKLPFGHFKVYTRKEEVIVKPLTQDEIADGWQLNVPKYQPLQPVHHWSVTLSQLPPHLWKKLQIDYKDNKPYIPIIKDGIYYYSINSTKHDNDLKSLYYEMQKGDNANIQTIKELLKNIDNEINGWLIIRAKKFVKDLGRNRYFGDLL
jgi:hypothetical protein